MRSENSRDKPDYGSYKITEVAFVRLRKKAAVTKEAAKRSPTRRSICECPILLIMRYCFIANSR